MWQAWPSPLSRLSPVVGQLPRFDFSPRLWSLFVLRLDHALSQRAAGVYLLRVQYAAGAVVRRVVVE